MSLRSVQVWRTPMLAILWLPVAATAPSTSLAQDTIRVLNLPVRLGPESLSLSATIPRGWREVWRAPDTATVSVLSHIRTYSPAPAAENSPSLRLDLFFARLPVAVAARDSFIRSLQNQFPHARLDATLRSLVWSQRADTGRAFPVQHAGIRTDTRAGLLLAVVSAAATQARAARLVRDSLLTSVSEVGVRAAPTPATSRTPAATSESQPPPAQMNMLRRFREACREYDAQPNEIRKSEVYRRSRAIIDETGPIEDWTGILERIRTNQGGSNATLVITIGSSRLYDVDVPIGSSPLPLPNALDQHLSRRPPVSSNTAFVYGLVGGFLLSLVRLAELANVPKIERPPTFSDWVWVLQFFAMPFAGGVLAYVYNADGINLKPVLALNIGLSAPVILKAMAAVVPRQLGNVG